MSNRLPKHLFDARQAAQWAMQFCTGLDPAAYAANRLVQSAVERQLEILGEASRRILDEAPALRDAIPELALAVGMRNRIIHGYDRVEHALVFDTVQRDLPLLIAALDRQLAQFPAP